MAEIKINDQKEFEQLNIDNFFPRGSILRNSGSGILALSIYTGPDSKLELNQGKLKYKRSNTDVTLNKIFTIQVTSVSVISVLLGLLGYAFM